MINYHVSGKVFETFPQINKVELKVQLSNAGINQQWLINDYPMDESIYLLYPNQHFTVSENCAQWLRNTNLCVDEAKSLIQLLCKIKQSDSFSLSRSRQLPIQQYCNEIFNLSSGINKIEYLPDSYGGIFKFNSTEFPRDIMWGYMGLPLLGEENNNFRSLLVEMNMTREEIGDLYNLTREFIDGNKAIGISMRRFVTDKNKD